MLPKDQEAGKPTGPGGVAPAVQLEGRPAPGAGSREFRVGRVIDGVASSDIDAVAIEEPLEIRLAWRADGQAREQTISITMRTPGNDLELAIGFLFTEGIVSDPAQVEAVDHCGPPVGPLQLRNVVKVALADGAKVDLGRLERHFYTTSSCGVCGKTSLEALRVQVPAPVENAALRVSAAALSALPDRLRVEQEVFGKTGGIHASALFDSAGRVLALREDVGRHNALDKLIGSLFVERRLPIGDFGVLVSGRASFELMQKAVMAGAGMLAAVGAPSSLAVELARDHGVALVGFLRGGRFNVYAGHEHIDAAAATSACSTDRQQREQRSP
jgi:FdhD protein